MRQVSDGVQVSPYAFLPHAGEVVLAPDDRYVVVAEPREHLGYLTAELEQQLQPPHAPSQLDSPPPAAAGPPRGSPAADLLADQAQRLFEKWDVDKSGELSLDEFRSGIEREAASPEHATASPQRFIAAAVAQAGGV